MHDNFPQHKVKINGVRLNYAQVGTGPALVFVHGLANNWEGWIPLIPFLQDHFTLYFLDLPGFGDSDSLYTYSVMTAADYVDTFIGQVLGEKPLAVVGASMGTLVTGALIQKHPDVAEAAILIGPVIKNGRTDVASRVFKISMRAVKRFDLSERALKKVLETRLAAYTIAKTINMHQFNRFIVDTYNLVGKRKMRKEAFTQMAISSAESNLKEVVEKVTLPTLLLYGREDRVSSPQFARQHLAPNNQHLTVFDVPAAGHVVPMEKPRPTARAIRGFLAAL